MEKYCFLSDRRSMIQELERSERDGEVGYLWNMALYASSDFVLGVRMILGRRRWGFLLTVRVCFRRIIIHAYSPPASAPPPYPVLPFPNACKQCNSKRLYTLIFRRTRAFDHLGQHNVNCLANVTHSKFRNVTKPTS